MSHFAEIDENNVVVRVIVAEQDFIDSGAVGDPKNWVQTSFNASIRKNFAAKGYMYDKEKDMFITKKPFDSWVLDDETGTYKASIERPKDDDDTAVHRWNEESKNWQKEKIR